MDKKIILTFDYELFLKKSGTIEKCLIEPTQKFIEQSKKFPIYGTFYVDVLFLLKIKHRYPLEYHKIRDQLKRLVDYGNRLELHLHPSWKDAVEAQSKDTLQWNFPKFDFYSLKSFSSLEIQTMFLEGKCELEEIAQEIKQDYRLHSFRAGGWSITPFKAIKDAMIQSDIYVDSTVAPGLYRESDVQNYDFRESSRDKVYWTFSNNPAKANEGKFTEWPITTYKISIFGKILRKIERKSEMNKRPDNFDIFGDGVGMSISDVGLRNGESVFHRILRPNMYTLQDVIPSELIRRIKNERRDWITFISHPKKLSNNSFLAIQKLAENGCEFYTIKGALDALKDDQ